MFYYKKAFTLAEILITLSVIGIIAVITIPSIIRKYQNRQAVTKLLKIYETLEQAQFYAVIDHGNTSGWNIVNGNKNSILEIGSYYEPYLNIVQKCSGNYNCWNPETKSLSGEQAMYNTYFASSSDSVSYKLKDGTNIAIDFWGGNHFGLKDVNAPYFIIFVDTNGSKKPNQYGRDIFVFGINKKNEIIPAGNSNNSANCTTSKKGSTSGFDCTYRVIKEKAINY